MSQPIAAKIDVTKVEKEHLFVSQKGAKYLDLMLRPNKDGKDQFGNDGFIVQGVTKEKRAAGVQGKIIGNFRYLDTSAYQKRAQAPAKAPQSPVLPTEGEDDVPF